MSSNIYALALKNTIDELQNTCPDILHALIFKNNELLAKTENTNETAANNTLNAFKAITERAEPIGNLTTATIQAAKGKVNISCINDFYMTTVLSKDADEKYINTITHALIPIVIKIVDNITPAAQDALTKPEAPEKPPETAEAAQAEETPQLEQLEQAEQTEETPAETEITPITAQEPETPREEETDEDTDSIPSSKPPVTQLIVENLSGILVRSDTVQIDKSLIDDWNELYGEDKIKEVHVETLNGKTTRCKFKPIKDSKQEGKGIIKIPEKIQITLETTQGELVMVKPVVK